ncbi:extracellular solute-binding protein [Neorhizobium alkalisoli]|uniref:Carbohydrate ABC transporter substrate-binding protein (CUT1 family) n=1 Tax=Neorhizobium alkalisoli TaxID=528178 RepID=A0A561PT04_9HYPH|nr:extracellular solute-binding protein [Neorhizobium alkalisoli]TWF41188.1 carbohydrate ABC transporter substrate-binding protein (CUT1 family) [Neorhizobium alkalisoli]
MSKGVLKGMTWSHPRGYDPMVAASRLYEEKTGVEVTWEKRSLQDFESFPVEELARSYDLIVIDHPHVGQITKEGCLLPLDVAGREDEREALERGSVGASYPSYLWQGRQWAFPIDAATQVQAYTPDLLPRPVSTWAQVIELAREGRVLLPLRAPHSLMTFYTLSANMGNACATHGPGSLIDPTAGIRMVEMMCEIAQLIDPACFDMDPIAVFEKMAEPGSNIACAPLIYGYVNYAMPGFRERLIRFADIPVSGGLGPVGSALGGTGIAVSAFTGHADAAIDFAYWVASGALQRGAYAAAGGQPGHAAAWEDDAVNEATSNFYRDTRETLEGAWVRPRHDGCMGFQQQASDRLNEGLKNGHSADAIIADLNRLFAASF